MDRRAYAYGQSGAAAILQTGWVSVQVAADVANDAYSENLPQSGTIDEVYVRLVGIAGGIVDGDQLSCKLSWTATEDEDPLSNADTKTIEVTGTTGAAVFSMKAAYRFPPLPEANGKLRVWLKHNRVGGTAQAKVRVTHRSPVGQAS